MQKTIKSFFKPSFSPKIATPTLNFDNLFKESSPIISPEITIKYTRKTRDSHARKEDGSIEDDEFEDETRSISDKDGLLLDEEFYEVRGERGRKEVGVERERVLNKKRSYAQFHLELGQTDFLLHTCKICGIKYAKGDVTDEKVHSDFHKSYTLGIPFKGWRHERVIHLPSLDKDRIILVLNDDPPSQRKKVREVVKMMEIDLGDGWIFHESCKVYLFISSHRIAGCVIVESIRAGHRIILDKGDEVSDDNSAKEAISRPTTLKFGDICFRRDVSRTRRRSKRLDPAPLGSIVCEEEATPASCGVRAIWVSQSNRRKHIATHLLDAVRQSFCTDHVLERFQLAFSEPTSAGKA